MSVGIVTDGLFSPQFGSSPGAPEDVVLYDGLDVVLESVGVDVELEPIRRLELEIQDQLPDIIVEIEDDQIEIPTSEEEIGVETS
jgi:hypothetical protein